MTQFPGLSGLPTNPVMELGRPNLLNLCLAAAGGAGGFAHARQIHSGAPLVYAAWGAALGFFIFLIGWLIWKLLQATTLFVVVAALINYAALVPLGFGDHMPLWIFHVEAWVRGVWLHGSLFGR